MSDNGVSVQLPQQSADLARARAKSRGFAKVEDYLATLIAEEAAAAGDESEATA